MSFWESDVGAALLSQKSALETLLDADGTRLEQVLDQDDLLQQCSNKNANLVDYLKKPHIVRRMIEYITFPVEENVAKYSEEHGIALDANDIEPPSFGVTPEQLELEQKTSAASDGSATPSSLSTSSASSASSLDPIGEQQESREDDPAESRSDEATNGDAEATTDEQLSDQLESVHISEPDTSTQLPNGHTDADAADVPADEQPNSDETETTDPATDLSEAKEEDTPTTTGVDAETKNLLEKIRVKYPYLCSEILASQLAPVLDCILSEDHGFLSLLFEHIRRDPPLDAVLTNYWRTAVVALTRREPAKIITYFRANNDILDRLIQHISDQSIMELVITLGWDPLIEELSANLDEIADWMREQDLIPKLIQMMRPECTPNDHSAASYTLVDIVAKSQRCTNLTLFGHLSSGEQVRNLMNGIFVENQSSMLESLSVLIALLHHYPNLRAEKQMALERERLGVGEKPKKNDGESSSSDSEDEGDTTGKDTDVVPPVIEAVLERMDDFKRLLVTPPEEPMDLSVGTLSPPLGPVRLKVVDLLVAVMRTPFPPMAVAFRERNIVGLCLDLFFEYPWNNLLHGSVEHIVQMTLSGASSTLKAALFEDNLFLEKVLAARKRSLAHHQETGLRLGFTGHLTRISNTVVEFGKRDEYLDEKMKNHVEWQAFMASGLREENDKLNVQLGGHRPAQIEDEDIMFHIDLGEKGTEKMLDDLEMTIKAEDDYRMPSDEDLTFGGDAKPDGAGQDWGTFGSWPFEDAENSKSPKQTVIPDDEGPHSSDEDEDDPEIAANNSTETAENDGGDDFASFLSSDADMFFAGDAPEVTEEQPSNDVKQDASQPIASDSTAPAGDAPADAFDWGGDPFADFEFNGSNAPANTTENTDGA